MYIELKVTINPFDQQIADILIANLADIDFDSFSETESGFLAYSLEEKFSTTRVVNVFQQNVEKGFSIEYSTKRIEDQNWNKLWESNFEPISVENLCRIRAPFHQPETGYQMELIIEPKMAFGTGHHQTTWLMVKELFSLKLKGVKVLDMGCGTGILAIVAEKLGALSIDAVDIDHWSVENTLENILANGCSKISVKQGDSSMLTGNKYDIILANINRNVLLLDIPVYTSCIRNGGVLLISGILTSDIDVITQKANEFGFKQANHSTKNDWALIEFIKE